MDILVVPDSHYYKNSEGEIFAESVYTYDFFKRYLLVFDKVIVLARVNNTGEIDEHMKKSNGPGVEFCELPDYSGPVQHLLNYWKLNRICKEALKKIDCCILRVPSATANCAWKYVNKRKVPVALEVVVDPELYFGKGTMKSILRPLIQYDWTRKLKFMCKHANGVSYVTKEYLQNKYPCIASEKGEGTEYFTGYYSSVLINEKHFGTSRKYEGKKHWNIIHVANYISGYRKGHKVTLEILKQLLDKGYDVDVIFIGDGSLKTYFMNMANDMGIYDNTHWLGRLSSSDQVFAQLKQADIMLFPTMAEGLPRVLLEAMASGLPCLSSPVCGIPEIIDKEMLIEYSNVNGYTEKIVELINNTQKLESISQHNILVAEQYCEDVLNRHRVDFYRKLRKCVEAKNENTI